MGLHDDQNSFYQRMLREESMRQQQMNAISGRYGLEALANPVPQQAVQPEPSKVLLLLEE